MRGLYPDEIPDEERFDCVYSISVLEHLPAAAIEQTCAALLEHTRSEASRSTPSTTCCSAPATPITARGSVWPRPRSGSPSRSSTQLLERLADDPETYFLSAEGHNRWRGATPYERFPMRRCVSIELCIPGRG